MLRQAGETFVPARRAGRGRLVKIKQSDYEETPFRETVMAANPLPPGIDNLFTLAEDMADGLIAHEATIGILQNTEARMRADLTAARTYTSAVLPN